MTRPDLPEVSATLDTRMFNAFRDALPENEALVPVENVSWLVTKATKIASRAARLSCEAPRLTLVTALQHQWLAIPPGYTRAVQMRRNYVHVRIEGEAPRIPGYTLLGAISHQHSEPVLKAAPGCELPAEARERAGDCDHCHKRRARHNTYVLHRVEDGHTLYVGSNCLADFLGGHDPKSALRWAEVFSSLVETAHDTNGPRPNGFDLMSLLPMVAACIRTHGWVSRSRAQAEYDGPQATVSQAWTQMNPLAREKMKEEDRVTPTEEDHAAALAAIQWAAELPSDAASDYERNIGIIARDGYALFNEDGFAASIVAAHARHLDKLREAERKARLPASEHFGEVKKRETWSLTLSKAWVSDGYYGTTYAYLFVREGSGDKAVWYASRDQELELDKTYRVTATVKRHDDHEVYGKQTVLTRGKVEG